MDKENKPIAKKTPEVNEELTKSPAEETVVKADTIEKPKTIKKKISKADDEYVTVNFAGPSLPIAMILSSLILAAGIGLGIYFGLSNRPLTTTTTGTSATDQSAANANAQNFDATTFPEVTVKVGTSALKGDRNAKVYLVEFGDMMCVFCRQFTAGIDVQSGQKTTSAYSQIINDYVNNGKVAFVYRHLPLPIHDPAATKMSNAAVCVRSLGGDDAFFKFHDQAFEDFADLQNTSGQQLDLNEGALRTLIGKTGVDVNRAMDCYTRKAKGSEITADMTDANDLRTQVQKFNIGLGTPGFVIGKLKDGVVSGRFINGAYPYVAFKNVIDEQLAK